MIIPVIISISVQTLDTLVRRREDLEGLSLPWIGEIPYIGTRMHWFKRIVMQKKTARQRIPQLVVEIGNQYAANAAFRNIRTHVEFMQPKDLQVGVFDLDLS